MHAAPPRVQMDVFMECHFTEVVRSSHISRATTTLNDPSILSASIQCFLQKDVLRNLNTSVLMEFVNGKTTK